MHGALTNLQHDEWHRFSSSLRIDRKFPGINGIGVILPIDRRQVDAHIAEQRQIRPDYRIYPPHENEELLPIVYIEPEDINKQAVGLDMAHEPNRYTAARAARESGETQITAPIVLVQDNQKTPGFLLFVPFYSSLDTSMLKSPSEREQAFKGIVYAPFIVKKLMLGTLAQASRQVGLRISDNNEIIYDELTPENEDFDSQPLFSQEIQVPIFGRQWTFTVQSSLSFRSLTHSREADLILYGGIIVDALILLNFLSVTRTGRQAARLAADMTNDLHNRTNQLVTMNEDLRKEAAIRMLAEQRADAANAAKSAFLGSMSHELRTPLNGILGFGEMILTDATAAGDAELQENAQLIVDSGHHLLSLINDLLDLTRIESGKFTTHLTHVSPGEIVEAVAPIGQKLLEASGSILKVAIDPNVRLYSDPLRVKQMLLNLLGNSAKYCSHVEVLLTVSAGQSADGKSTCIFTVHDTGNGIPASEKESIFSPFHRLKNAEGASEGTGLGLPLTRELARQMGGDCTLEASERGARFVITLPATNDLSFDPADQTEPAPAVS